MIVIPAPMTVIPAQAGISYPPLPRKASITFRPARSTLSRRVRGVLSPYRERGFGASRRVIPAYAGMTVGYAGAFYLAAPR